MLTETEKELLMKILTEVISKTITDSLFRNNALLRKQNENLSEKLELVTRTLGQMEQEKSLWKEDLVRNELGLLEEEKALLKTDVETLSNTLKEVTEECAKSKESLAHAWSKISEREEIYSRVEKKNAELFVALNDKTKDLEQTSLLAQSQAAKLSSLEMKLNDFLIEKTQLEEKLMDKTQVQNEAQQQSMIQLEQKLLESLQRTKEVERANNELRRANENSKQTVARLEEKVSDLEELVKSKEKEFFLKSEENLETERKLNETNEQLQKEIENNTKLANALKKCVDINRRCREQIIKLNQKLGMKPLTVAAANKENLIEKEFQE